jgi:hypothetical protein
MIPICCCLSAHLVHRDGLGFIFGMRKCDFFSLSPISELAYRENVTLRIRLLKLDISA